MNVPLAIAAVVSSKQAKLYELQTVYGGKDLYDLLEIVNIDNHNQRIASAGKD